MWCLGSWFSGGLGSAGLTAGLISNLNDPMILPTADVNHREVGNALVPGTDTEALAAHGAVT